MLPLLVVLVILVPFVEVAVLFLVADAIGWPIALALFVLVPLVGLLILRNEGLGAFGRLQTAARQGRLPGRDVVDAMLISLAGVLLVIPGFVTAFAGVLLLVPPLRRLATAGVVAGMRRQIERKPRIVVSVTTETPDDAWGPLVEAGQLDRRPAQLPAPSPYAAPEPPASPTAGTPPLPTDVDVAAHDWELLGSRDWEEAPERRLRRRQRRARGRDEGT